VSAGSRELRRYLDDGSSHLLVGAYDALTARAAEAAGFEIVYVSGYATAAAVFGLPDVGLTTMNEMVDTCSRICSVVERPVLVDADNGYGNVLNVKRAVRAFEATGAAGLHLEDQTFPKRCGHMTGKTLVPVREMEGKLRVALDARRSDDFVVIARTDAIAVEGVDSAIRRALAYREAGADVSFVDAPESIDQIERIAKEVPGPLLFDWSYDGVTPPASRSRLAELGYQLILFPDIVAAVHRAVSAFLSRLATTDSLTDLTDALTPFAALNDFAHLPEWLELESRHA
jgi:2,3-dimethylmalate lyase